MDYEDDDKEVLRLGTTGLLASELGVSIHQVLYIIKSREIKPAAYAGHIRLYDQEGIALIRHELNAIAARRVNMALKKKEIV